ncbi:MAG TPA: PHP-associated domain-containing protein [Candidatus Saccharimonadales bacterium]|nr:PHP-associated domain-containing protein [Candidatus Saccharimonadales bacterium]
MYKIDLHTHSTASPDGGLSAGDYRQMLAAGRLDVIAVTDHNTITGAQLLQAELGIQIIVGEEISTTTGDLIGLYLTEAIPAGLEAAEAARRIKAQHGLVYVPHPFEQVRKGIGSQLEALAAHVDIIEIHNGRSLSPRGNALAKRWATAQQLPGAASSDAHGMHGWGRTYTMVAAVPTAATLPALLARATYVTARSSLRGALYPKANKLRKRLGHGE